MTIQHNRFSFNSTVNAYHVLLISSTQNEIPPVYIHTNCILYINNLFAIEGLCRKFLISSKIVDFLSHSVLKLFLTILKKSFMY